MEEIPSVLWLAALPKEIFDRAIENIPEEFCTVDICEYSLGGAIMSSFAWFNTPEGYEYWSDVHRRAQAGEFY